MSKSNRRRKRTEGPAIARASPLVRFSSASTPSTAKCVHERVHAALEAAPSLKICRLSL
jgi:hypothetical protein